MTTAKQAKKLARSGHPARRAQGKAYQEPTGLPLWVWLFLATILVSSTFFTLLASWGFSGQPSAQAFLLAGAVSMAALSFALFALRFVFAGVRGESLRKFTLILVALAVMATGALATAGVTTQEEEESPPPVSSGDLRIPPSPMQEEVPDEDR